MKHAEYISQIEIESLWSGQHHVLWTLDKQVNILSGMNGVGKSTILNKVVRALTPAKGCIAEITGDVHLTLAPDGADTVRFDYIRSFDRPLINPDAVSMLNGSFATLATELDFQIFTLQRRYLDYQVNIGNRMIAALQSGDETAAERARAIMEPKQRFQNLVDELFADTAKRIIRTENEIRFSQLGETLLPHQLSSGEKQMLAILLTVLVEDGQPHTLFLDEPEVSMHIEWQQRLIDDILCLNPNAQIVLATHSPAVIMNGWTDHVTDVDDIKD